MTSIRSRATQKANNVPAATGHWSWSIDVEITNSDLTPDAAQIVLGRATTVPPATTADFETGPPGSGAPPATFNIFGFDSCNLRFIESGHWRITLAVADMSGPGPVGHDIWVGIVDSTAEAPQPVFSAVNLGTSTS